MSKSIINVKFNNYIPTEVNVQKCNRTKETLLTAVLFLLSGCPNSFSIQDTLWLELPWFEVSQPEGFNLVSWLLLMQAVSSVIFLGWFYIETHVITCSKIVVLWCASFATVLMSIVLSFGWNFTLNGLSLFLFLGSFVGQMVGWVQFIFVIPWIANNFNPRMISPFASGNPLMILFLVVLELMQEPGGERNFSPGGFYRLAAIVYAATFGVCVYTFHSGIGRLTPTDEVKELETWRKSLCIQIFPEEFWDTKFYTFGRIWANQWTWTAGPMALPYAAKNTTPSSASDGEDFLQWATALGYLMMLVGSVASYIPTEKYWLKETLALNTMANALILVAAGNIGDWSTWTMKVTLMTAVAASRFSIGWFVPLCFRELTRRFPKKSELLVRSNSLWHLFSNIIIRTLVFFFSIGVLSL